MLIPVNPQSTRNYAACGPLKNSYPNILQSSSPPNLVLLRKVALAKPLGDLKCSDEIANLQKNEHHLAEPHRTNIT